MRKNKQVSARMRNVRAPAALPWVIFVLVFLSISLYLVQSFKTNSFFKIKDVIIREGSVIRDDRDDDLKFLTGKNIFTLDLKESVKFIQSMYPAYRTARLVKFLPNQMCLDLMKRTAVACLNTRPALYIDDRMTFFDSIDAAAAKGLPVVSGINTAARQFRAGMRAADPDLLFAVRLIQQAKKNPVLKKCAIERVVIHGSGNASLYLSGALEVRIGPGKLDDSLQILASLLRQVGNGVSNIEYIDLRFKDPVIRFKGKEA